MAISHDMVEDNKFRVELLECAKSLNLKSDDYIKELFNEIPLEYYHVQEDMKNESIIHSTKVEGGEECKDHCISKQFLFEKFIDTDDAKNVITRDSIELEEPLFPKKMRLDDNFINYKVPTIKSLTPNYNSTQIPEPFIEGDMQTYTIEDLCPLYHEAMEDEITSATSLLKEQEVDHKNEIIFIDLKLENKYFEEPLSSSKAIVCKQQDIPNSMSELISLFNEEIELILPNDGQNSVIEESGIKLPLETMNKWERVEDDTIDDSGETLSNNSNESATILNIPSSREMYELEPVLIPAKNNPLEMGRRRQTDSLMTVINHIIPENAVPTPSKQDEDEELQKDLDNMIKVETPFDQWQFIIMQPMDEICGLKFKVPLLPHPVTYISSDIPSRLSDLVISNSSKSDFQILAPFSGLKALELILHWDPIKNFVILKIEEIVDVSDTPYDDLTKIIQEENICFDSDNLLDLIDFKITNESEEIHLRSKKEKKKDKKLKQKESATGFNAPRVKSAAITTFSNLLSEMRNNHNDANYSQMKTPNYNDSSLTNFSQMKASNHDSSLINYSQMKAPNYNDNSMIIYSQMKAPNNDSSASNPNNRLLTNNSRTKAPNSNKSSNRKKKQSKPNKQNESVDIQQLLRKPTIGSFRNVGNSMPNVMSWIQEENEDDVNLPEFVNESISGQDRVTQWLSSCLKSKNVYNDIEVIDLTQNTDLPTPEKYAVDNSLVIDLTQDADLSTPEKYAVDNTQVVDLPTPEKSAVDNSSIETSPYFKNKSSVEQNHHNAIRFSNSFSATRSIDDFLILRGKLSAEKRREIEQNNVAIGKSILEQLSMPVVPHKYIVSVRMFPNRRLLTALKSKDCKVDLIERDFEYMKPFLLEEKSEVIHVEVDFIIDERTGVIFYPLNMLSQDQSVLKLVQTILRLHLKYPNLYVILETYTWNNRSTNSNMEYTISTYPFTLPILRSTSELRLILMCCNCNATIMFSLCEEMSAKLLRMIGDSCATRCDREGVTRIGNHGWKDHKQWEGRDWMTMEESLHERFLSCFTPLINPFTAQIILTATTLLQFFQMSHLERCALVGGWIDESRLKKFDEIIHEILSIDSINDTEQTFTTGGLPVIVID
ncbi:hypothetical protein C1645_737644 [Glomus cerebriforme]|uniref:Uncharacterized protein n=1 Tax=Glomus cerebriforme TaxID=658196 RepID=A0A397T3C0_9GLOM|nr:hypothetical protein C1645_737644 [Glomus cerebriforme]